MSIYRIREDMYHANKWYLGDIRGVDNWAFLRGDVDIDPYRQHRTVD